MSEYLQYMSPWWRKSILHGVPMVHLDDIMQLFGSNVRIRYRGPRNTPADIGRSYITRSSSCLKQNATSFAVYPKRKGK